MTQPPKRSAAILMNGGPFLLIACGLMLTILQKGIIGLPLIFIGITWLRRTRVLGPMKPSGGRKSTVRSSYLEMELDHDTGELDGQIIAGSMQGTRLSRLSEEELLVFLEEIKSDPESVSLLESFLNRYHQGWQNKAQSSESSWDESSNSGTMSKQEARQILGVTPDASREEILDAYRRLIKRVHPDSGGSPFLAAKINAAKAILLGE